MKALLNFPDSSEYNSFYNNVPISNISGSYYKPNIVSFCKTNKEIHYNKKEHIIPIEYLQSSGTQYIDTKYIPKMKTTLNIDMIITNNGDIQTGCIETISGHNVRFHMGKYSNTFQFGINDSYKNTSAQNNNRHILEINANGTSKLDNTTYTVGNAFTTNNMSISIFLFARNTNNSATCNVQGKLFSAKIYENNVLIHDLIPIRINQDGYMYDKVYGKLYGNLGTGNFILGPDL